MKKILFCFICIWLFASPFFSASAQQYLQATVYFRSGQSEIGKIYYSNWTVTPQEIRFISESGMEKKCTPSNVEKVEVKRNDGKFEYYKRAEVFVNRSSNKIADLESTSAPRLEKDTLFLQTLMDSKVSIHLFKDNDSDHFFIEKDTIKELIYKQYRPDPNVAALSENNKFRQQLLMLTYDDNQLKSTILAANYTRRTILKIVRSYNEHKGSEIFYEYHPESVKIRFFVGIGVSMSSLISVRSGYEVNYAVGEANKKITTIVTPAIGIILPVPRTNARFLLSNDLSLGKSNFSYDFEPVPPATFNPEKEQIDLNFIQLHTLLRWKAMDKRQRFFLTGGVFNSWIVRDRSRLTIGSAGGQYDKIQRKYDFGITTGLNYGFKQFSIDVRYQVGRGSSPSAYAKTALQRFAIILMYNL